MVVEFISKGPKKGLEDSQCNKEERDPKSECGCGGCVRVSGRWSGTS